MHRRTFLTISTLSLINIHAIDFRETKKEAWKTRDINSTMKQLYGNKAFESIKKSTNIELIAPKHLVENAYSIPITIKSSIKAKSVSILQTANEESLIAVFTVPKNEIINYSTNIKMERKGTLFIVVEALNGQLYYVRQFIEVSSLSCVSG